MQFKLLKARRVLLLLGILLVALLSIPGASLYYEYSGGESCARCHEIWQPYTDWRSSTHRNVACSECHGDVFTLDAGFHLNNMRRVFTHLRGDVPQRIRLKNDLLFETMDRCQKCHEQEFAEWQAGPHSTTYAKVFLDSDHNRQRLLMDDCLRCHGMHFDGGIRDLVTPVDTAGPWKLTDHALADRPAIPCLTCHQMHHEGLPLAKPSSEEPPPAVTQEIMRPSMALFDRRGLDYIAAELLPLPNMLDGRRRLRISPDIRQALCYQCHAPLPTFQVNSGDDRTAIGVHEGISCLACHQKHRQTTRPSCNNCHPRMSNCGLDVATMDTTFKSPKSPHNIHFVKCLDCHPRGVRRKVRASTAPPQPGGTAVAAARTPFSH
jgi:RNase P subunit RPR2